MLNSNLSSFQAGVDSIYNTCKTYGSTPSAKTPAAINTSIQTIYNNRYTAGYNAGTATNKSIIFTKSVKCSGKSASLSVDITSEYSNYANITVDNISVHMTGTLICYGAISSSYGVSTYTISYNSEKGKITAKVPASDTDTRYFYSGNTYKFKIAIVA